MATSKLSARDSWCASQLKIVLLGGRNSGKHSLGNLLLGKEEFVTRERTRCSRRLGLVAGRWLTVVDTPGWWCDFSVQDTSELVKLEILSSISLCSPGPHVFLITVKASSVFTEKRGQAVEEHVSLLGEEVWSHCMIVFTCEDRCGHAVAEECVRAGGKALRRLSHRCGQRCHSVTLREDAEITQLLDEMQKLVTQNGNRVFETDQTVLQEAAEQKRSVEARAQQRFTRMKKHRALMRERLRPVTNIRIVLLGAKGSGKTSALNTILSRETSQPLRRTGQCVVGKGLVFGREVTVVDTPGWWMNYLCNDSSVFDRREMALSLSLCPPGPHVFLLVIRVDRAFAETYRGAAQEHLQLIGGHIWRRVVVLFTFGDWLGGTGVEQYIESEGQPLRWLVEKCGNRYHVLNNKTKEDGFQVRELIGKIEEMLAGCDSGWHYEMERKVMEQLQDEMRREKERAEKRLMRKTKQRQMARAQLENVNPLTEISIVLVSGRKTGKSSCGNTILSRVCFDTDTQTTSCSENHGLVSGRQVTVLDTPACFSVTPDLLTAPCAVLLVVNVSSSFRSSQWEAMEKQLEPGGEQAWSRAAVLFSHGDRLGGTSVEQHVESEGEPLQRLVEACGNRYHVLDNKQRGDGAQVAELIDLMEEMLAEERPAVLRRGDHLWEIIPSVREQQPEAVATCRKDFKEFMEFMIHRRQLSRGLTESASSSSCPALNCSEGPGAVGQIEALSPGGTGGQAGRTCPDRDGFMSRLACVISAREGLIWATAAHLPVWSSRGQVHPFSPTRPTALLAVPQTEPRALVEDSVVPLRGQSLGRLSESEGLQALIDHRGHSSLEELEAFIDSHFEMMWEQTMGSVQTPHSGRLTIEHGAAAEVHEEEDVLTSINRKLTKLELLEEIREDVAELRDSLAHSWEAIQELRARHKQDASNSG